MILSILAGNVRGLPFYDFPYELNALLALAGFFYIIAILKTIKAYEVKPLWVKVSLVLVIISPFALLLLMNPDYGQVEKMLMGPHGDNTLGMSFALMAIYYLAIKLASYKITFQTRWHILWQIPLGFLPVFCTLPLFCRKHFLQCRVVFAVFDTAVCTYTLFLVERCRAFSKKEFSTLYLYYGLSFC